MSWQWVTIMCGISSASQVNWVAPWINSSTDVVWPNVYVTLAYKLALNLMNKECGLLVLSAVTVGVLRCCSYSTLCIWTVSLEWINYNEIYNFKESHGVIGRGVLLGISRVWINQPYSPTISYNLCTKKTTTISKNYWSLLHYCYYNNVHKMCLSLFKMQLLTKHVCI